MKLLKGALSYTRRKKSVRLAPSFIHHGMVPVSVQAHLNLLHIAQKRNTPQVITHLSLSAQRDRLKCTHSLSVAVRAYNTCGYGEVV